MKLTIEREEGEDFVVDDPNEPGSPYVGRGKTVAEAVGNWFINNQPKANVTFELNADVQKFVTRSNAVKLGLHR